MTTYAQPSTATGSAGAAAGAAPGGSGYGGAQSNERVQKQEREDSV